MLALTDWQNLADIADAIRSKTGTSDTYLPSEMAGAISTLSPSDCYYRVRYYAAYGDESVLVHTEFVETGGLSNPAQAMSGMPPGMRYAGEYSVRGEAFEGDPEFRVTGNADVLMSTAESHISVVQAYVQEYAVTYSDDGYTATFEFEDGMSDVNGFVLDTGGLACTLTESGRRWQYGTCVKTATLPTIITTGSGRSTYTHNVTLSGSAIAAAADRYCFAGITTHAAGTVRLTVAVQH